MGKSPYRKRWTPGYLEREKINTQLQSILDLQTDPWGIKVATVEVKQIDLPDEMRRSMAKQAEAERERRAKVICGGRISGRQSFGRGGRHHPEVP